MASCLAAGTAYANYGVPMIPFYIYYSMFGYPARGRPGLGVRRFARQGLPDGRHCRAHHAARARDCSTRTATARCCSAWFRPAPIYDPAYAYELAVIIQDGIRRMYQERRGPLLLHLRLQRKLCAAADARDRAWRIARVREGILKGIYKYQAGGERSGGGAVVRQRLDSERSAEGAADSGGALSGCDRRLVGDQLQRTAPRRPGGGALEPSASRPRRRGCRTSRKLFEGEPGPIIASSDYMKAVPDQLVAVAGRAAAYARHRRLRAQRESRAFAQVLRDLGGSDRAGDAFGAGARRQDRRRAREGRDRRTRIRSRDS